MRRKRDKEIYRMIQGDRKKGINVENGRRSNISEKKEDKKGKNRMRMRIE